MAGVSGDSVLGWLAKGRDIMVEGHVEHCQKGNSTRAKGARGWIQHLRAPLCDPPKLTQECASLLLRWVPEIKRKLCLS